MKLKLEEIANLIDGSIEGDTSKEINGINSLNYADSNEISYAVSVKYKDALIDSNAGAVIVDEDLKKYCKSNTIIVKNVYLAYSILSHKFKHHQDITHLRCGSEMNYPNTVISKSSLIGRNVKIGINTIIHPNCVIEDNSIIGNDCLIESNVTIQLGSSIGDNCVISSGAVIGSEGFGNARDENKKWNSIAHIGNVSIGNNVSIGANTSIDRGSIASTEIGNGVKIDNLVHIAHNVIIGEDTAIAAKTGIAGSTIIGKRCMIGGAVGIVGHLKITDDVVINATSTVNKNIMKSGVYTSFMPIMPHTDWKKVGLWITKLDKIANFMKIKLRNIR
ncbi:UDP-3-O-(3-hydroxymyristoyl)glucosamine N-acyltransferase [bacterium]|nr:UDP-3-O-(3-hydroxymyristoyl)glucosamine N-acyltransferase [bacterium]|tara:strand:- start:100 stop:1098 length:999 start_codon:yes stop_codon:yes gene_type:complete